MICVPGISVDTAKVEGRPKDMIIGGSENI
jgi:hypothetical protein